METQTLVEGLCSELGHPEAASSVVKKLVVDNWLDKADDLSCVPRTRLEGWGAPLKLIDELYEFLTDQDATQALNGASAFVKYNVRPFTDAADPRALLTVWRDDALKRQKPDEWAARRLQYWFRRRQEAKLQDLARPATDEVVNDWLDGQEFSSLSEEEIERRRLKRADEAFKKHISTFVKLWRERKRQESMAIGSGQVSVVGVKNLKAGVTNPHCTIDVPGRPDSRLTVTIGEDALMDVSVSGRRQARVQVGDAIEVEVWEKDSRGRKAEVLGKASLKVGREHFRPTGWRQELQLSLPGTRLALRKSSITLLVESAQAQRCARVTDMPGEPLKGIAIAVARIHKGQPKSCPVTELLYRLGRELKRHDNEITPLIHRLVTVNWLEQIADLNLAQDRHWEAWGFPEKLVVMIKAEVREQQEDLFYRQWENVQERVASNVASMWAWTGLQE